MIGIVAAAAYAGYHVRVVLDEAATSKRAESVVTAIPKIITVTNTIEKVLHENPTPCVTTPLPAAIADKLRQQ